MREAFKLMERYAVARKKANGTSHLQATGKPGHLIEMDDTTKIFSNPTEKATEDYISGRFG